jgi:N-acetylglutamate synthase-like GNAT family acetyltransferase
MNVLLENTFGPSGELAFVDRLSNGSRRVGPLVSLFVEPSERGNGLGEALFRAMMRESRVSGNDFALLVHQDNGSGKLIRWYQMMGFKLLPTDNAIGVEKGMICVLPRDVDGAFYWDSIRAASSNVVYSGHMISSAG